VQNAFGHGDHCSANARCANGNLTAGFTTYKDPEITGKSVCCPWQRHLNRLLTEMVRGKWIPRDHCSMREAGFWTIRGARGRFFGHSRFVSPAEKRRLEEAGAAEKALTWRASIYRKDLRAIPPRLQNRTKMKQNNTDELNERARIERRLEPWIHRELEAILGDQDLTVLVHLVLSLWFSRLRKQEGMWNLIPSSNEYEFMQQLEPFLNNKANAF